ncbi:acyltransferase [Emticicia sp. 21SJ11W-3]|uniref:acyltransferase family protein n=1 Tax=Emticicia sp. 21SJ11W-3 TaxID=2916755 RepID=UPI00209EC868|nr:acyltransferase [Emticicia sp. 21SJ11W-3]UTA66521.1 acyltransferase [Emticicia sp. 21SJ11W-3]
MLKKTNRSSNIELLRLFAMLYIVVYHFILHSVIPTSPELDYLIRPIIGVLHIGVICFVLISGYAGISFSLKNLVKLLILCSVYSTLIYLVACLIRPDLFGFRSLPFSLLPLQWWYVRVYVGLYLLAPLINIPLQTATRRRKLLYIALLGVVSCILGQFTGVLADGKNVVNFIFLYYVGHYIRHHLRVIPRRIVLIYLAYNVAVFFSVLALNAYPTLRDQVFRSLFFSYNSPGLIISGILFFLCFLSFQFNSGFVNRMAASVFPVYLLHENKYLSHYLYDFVGSLKAYVPQPALLMLVLVLLGVVVILVCVLIDKVLSPVISRITDAVTHSRLFEKISDFSDPLLARIKKPEVQ